MKTFKLVAVLFLVLLLGIQPVTAVDLPSDTITVSFTLSEDVEDNLKQREALVDKYSKLGYEVIPNEGGAHNGVYYLVLIPGDI